MFRRELSIRDILLLTVGMLTLLIAVLVASETLKDWHRLQDIRSLKNATILSDQLFEAGEKLSVERDIAYSMLHAPSNDMINTLRPGLSSSRKEADYALNLALLSLKYYDLPGLSTQLEKTEKQINSLHALRVEIDEAIALPLEKRNHDLLERWFTNATATITQTQMLWMGFIKNFSNIDSAATLHMRFKHILGIIMEYSGRERSLIGRLIVDNAAPTAPELAQLQQWQGTVDLGWKISDTLADQGGLYPDVAPYFQDAKSHYFTIYDMIRGVFYAPDRHGGTTYPISVDFWLEMATQTTDSLYALKDAALNETHNHITSLEKKALRSIGINSTLLLLALFLCLFCFRIIIRRVIFPVNYMIQALIDATEGKPLSFIPPSASQRDEIGRLTHVLYVFQQKMEEIKRYSSELERSNKELDDFSYIASHDLKEPLRGIHNHARFLLEDNQDKLDPDSVSRLGRLVYLSQRMELLVNDLLYFSRLGRQDLAIQPANINEAIHDIENTLDVFLAERNAHITIPHTLPTIVCDKVRVTELFRNLITNAVKYNEKETKTVEIGFMETHHSQEDIIIHNVFFVKDNGKGIASEFYEEIFRIFKRLQNNKNQKEEGTGVGLTFVKKIIERHGGKIWLASELGIGTTFYFTLGEHNYDTAART